MKRIEIFDTTLRDGTQGMDINFNLADKLHAAKKLDEMNIDFIEGGFPFSNKKDEYFFNKIKKEHLSHSKIVSFGFTRCPDTQASSDPHIMALLNTETEYVSIVGKAWKAHVEKILHITPEQNLELIFDSISFMKSQGRKVFFDLEHFFDGWLCDKAYTEKVLKTASEAGADRLILCDTNGGTLPGQVSKILSQMNTSSYAPMGVHFHNDCGTAVANSLIALEYDNIIQVQGTVNGWGERCGNTNLCALIPDICLKTENTADIAEKLENLTHLSRYFFEVANIRPDKRQPYVGEAAFSHKAGLHTDAVLKAENLIEHVSSSAVGNYRKILLSELSGKSTVLAKMNRFGHFTKDSREVKKILKLLKEKENAGYEYEAAEASFQLLILKSLGKYRQFLELNNYHLETFKTGEAPAKTVARIFMMSEQKNIMGAGISIGPVDALNVAMRGALLPLYPFLKEINLVDYKVRIFDPQSATAAKVRVLIRTSDGIQEWDTIGVSENIIEASWEALVDSMDYYYNILRKKNS
ncbi:MAG: citramalate synthase [Spirochaetia bacterium]|nr:citramalate synthase [Spirochaetia bacterium]